MSKSGEYFHFKQFSIRHDRCTMKVGTDGVLLGAWADVNAAKIILDIGTGSGVIALMLAQRTESDVKITAVEVERDDALQAKENTAASPWPDKVNVQHTSIQQFKPSLRYDLIVSNPPYFINSQKPPNERRIQVRHTTTLDYPTLLSVVNSLLADGGRFALVLPYSEGLQFIALAEAANLHCFRQHSFRTRKEKPIERWLLEFSREKKMKEEGEVLLYAHGLQWSEEYIRLTRDFYLKV